MSSRRLLSLALLVFAACNGGPTGGGAGNTLVVVVSGPSGAAIAGVEVRVEPGGRIQRTDIRGTARFAELPSGEYVVTITANGSAPVERRVDVRSATAEVRVTIGPASLSITGDGMMVDWGAPETLRAVLAPGVAGEVVWLSTRDLYLDQPVVLGRGPAVTTSALRPGTDIVEARLVANGQTAATASATVTVRYRESWNMDLLGLVEFPNNTVGDVWVTGRLALVTRRGAGGFSVVDVDRLAEIGRFAPGGSFSQDIHANGSLVYVTNESGSFRHAVTIVDISDPAAPRELGGVPFSVTPGAHTVWVDGTTAYLANTPTRQIQLWNVADPANPVRLATIAGSASGVAHDMYVRGGLMFGCYMALGGGAAELVIASVQDPANPVVLARTSYPQAVLTHSAWLSADGRYLYVADEVINAPIRIFDVANAANPVLVGTYQPRLGTVPHHFQVRDGRFAYLAHYKNGVEVLDVSDPLHPRLVGFYDTHPGAASDGAVGGGSANLYEGVWGVHWTDDGRIVASDMNRGLFVLGFRG